MDPTFSNRLSRSLTFSSRVVFDESFFFFFCFFVWNSPPFSFTNRFNNCTFFCNCSTRTLVEATSKSVEFVERVRETRNDIKFAWKRKVHSSLQINLHRFYFCSFTCLKNPIEINTEIIFQCCCHGTWFSWNIDETKLAFLSIHNIFQLHSKTRTAISIIEMRLKTDGVEDIDGKINEIFRSR